MQKSKNFTYNLFISKISILSIYPSPFKSFSLIATQKYSSKSKIKGKDFIVISVSNLFSSKLRVSPFNDPVFDIWIKIPDGREDIVIYQIIPMQILAYLLAIKKGNNPDYPRNLAKSVTVK